MTDMDMELKRLFDERLAQLTPPERTRRPARRRLRAAALGATGVFVLSAAVLVFDVNSVAAADGADCASFFTKVQVWALSHRSDLAGTDHSAAKAELAKMVASTGCSPHNATHDATHSGPHH